MASYKSKTVVSPLIIPKSRIQSVPNKSPNQSAHSELEDGWTTPTVKKRANPLSTSPDSNPATNTKKFASQNRFAIFPDPVDETEKMEQDSDLNEPLSTQIKPPPLIFIRTVKDYKAFCDSIKEITKGEPFSCKSCINGIKLSTSSADSYRTVIKFLQSNKADFHTFQLKEDRAFRVVIRNLHHSTPISEIKNELIALGHTPRNITNVLQRITKQPLPLFFIDLEPNINNRDVFNIDQLFYSKIKIEEPRANHQPIQCLRCQGFSHTKSYCNHAPKCVRCGDPHTSDRLPSLQKIQASHNSKKSYSAQVNRTHTDTNVTPTNVNTSSNMNSLPKKTYANATKNDPSNQPYPSPNDTSNTDNLAHQMASFLNSFQATINPLISLLTSLIEKLIHPNNDDLILLNIPLKTPSDLDNAVQSFTNVLQNAAQNSSQMPSNAPNVTKDLPLHITQLISEKRRARCRWLRTHLPSDKKKYNALTCSLKNVLRKYNSEKYLQYLKSLSSSDNSLWKSTKNVLKEKNKTHPLRYPDRSLASSNLDKANLFATDLENKFTPHTDILNLEHAHHVETSLINTLPMCLPTKHTSPSEVKNIISKLRNNKSPGHDLITNTITKKLPKKAILLLTYIYNGILRLSYIPSTWKHSVIILIHKLGKPPDIPSSYRPISLLPTFSKILEKIILKRICPILNEKNIIPNAQFGFRSNHSSLHQIHRIADNIASSLEQKNFCSGVFLDVAQAFDRVWHEGLLYKLLFLPTQLYLTLKSFLTNRSFVVRCEEEYSNIHPIRAGVPQGSILAPTLFNIYTADLPQSNNTNLATFADDTAIISSSPNLDSAINNLQDHLTNLQN
ncbi:hypothetical protein QTP88_020103 [Uroleucon formosanum]